jgi:hypothetical protein
MISYDRLGSNGRLGNQMFQYAALRGIAANRGFDWSIPDKNTQSLTDYCVQLPFKMIHLKENNIRTLNSNIGDRQKHSFGSLASSNPQVRNRIEKSFEFDEDLFNNVEDNTNIDGFFQTEKYFKNIENEIREDFEFIDDILEPCKEFISQFNGNVIFLHIRRGDAYGFEHLCKHKTIDGYYTPALENFDDNTAVIVCSDEIDWCGEQEFFKNDRFYLSENNEKFSTKCWLWLDGNPEFRNSTIPYTDLCLMSLCNGGITATSSLSWWGAWLQKNRTNPIIVPDPWFGLELMKSNNTKDLIPNDWIQFSW